MQSKYLLLKTKNAQKNVNKRVHITVLKLTVKWVVRGAM